MEEYTYNKPDLVEQPKVKTIQFKVPAKKVQQFIAVVSISQLILMVEQIYMLSKLNDVPDRNPEFLDYFKIVCQHVVVILLLCLELFYLQGDDDYDYKSIKSVASFYLIQATTYATVPWFTGSETLQSFTAQVL